MSSKRKRDDEVGGTEDPSLELPGLLSSWCIVVRRTCQTQPTIALHENVFFDKNKRQSVPNLLLFAGRVPQNQEMNLSHYSCRYYRISS